MSDTSNKRNALQALDCISRQAAIDALEREKVYMSGFQSDGTIIHPFDKYNRGLEDGIEALKALPSAQPEIIRCKDCLMHGVCRFEQGLGLDGYCSQAKRRQ